MSNVLERVYGFFLQQATAMAQLAANQLAFERQEIPPPFIQTDYWEAPTESAATAGGDGQTPDRRGLTGSARLLQDIYRLDQHAFETNQRKLQLSKTISLLQLAPAEFQRFHETGVMRFATPMDLFDRDFPGHYMRLIQQVSTSVIALIPPAQGIRATLSTTGTSRVVISGETFQPVIVQRGPDSVALSSPREATGLFELNPQPEMLLPFEGLGVDTSWEFQLPRAANLFDYRTIADVLITIKYTALSSDDYRAQVIHRLSANPEVSAQRPFSFRQTYADQWYDLHNPEQTTTPMTVRFQTTREDFPANIQDLVIQHLVLYFARANGQSFEIPVDHLALTLPDGAQTIVPGVVSTDGMINTRLNSGTAWLALIGRAPTGEWELGLPNADEVKHHFEHDEIDDILFVIAYAGRVPDWPG
jgi:Tc toxin complex TcA C-terminal TcB-binding domain